MRSKTLLLIEYQRLNW